MKKRMTGGQSASKKKNNLLNSQSNYQTTSNNGELQNLTTVNYFISNPNFAPHQSTTNNIIIMNKRLGTGGSSAQQNVKGGLLPASSASMKRGKQQTSTKNEESIVPTAKSGGGNELAKLFGNEKNFQLIKSLMDTGNQQTAGAQSGPRMIGVNNQNSSFAKVRKGVIDENINDKEVKVEKALLDLNDLKNQMFDEKVKAKKDLSPSNAAAARSKINTVTNNFFRETGFSNNGNNKFG